MRSLRVSLGAQTLENLPPVQEMKVRSLDREDPLEKEMATHSSTRDCKLPRTEEPGGLVHGVTKGWTQLRDQHFGFSLSGEFKHVL